MTDKELPKLERSVLEALARIPEQDVKAWLLGDEAHETLGRAELAKREALAEAREAQRVKAVYPRSANAVPVDQLARWRAEAQGLDKLAARGSARRATASVMDVSVVVSLLDEVDRLRRALEMQADDGSNVTGPIPAATLTQWRALADGFLSGKDSDPWTLADRLLAAIQELEARRSGAASALAAGERCPPR